MSELISDADFVRETTQRGSEQAVTDPFSGSTVTVNGLGGNVVLGGGTTGFGFTPTAPNITLTLTIATGAIPFGNAAGNGLGADSANLRYDDTNNQFKVGTVGASIPATGTAQIISQDGVGAVNGNKIIYLFNNGTVIKLDAYDYGGAIPLDLAFGGNGGNRLIPGLPVYANNAAAVVGGLSAGMIYRTGGDPDLLAVVH